MAAGLAPLSVRWLAWNQLPLGDGIQSGLDACLCCPAHSHGLAVSSDNVSLPTESAFTTKLQLLQLEEELEEEPSAKQKAPVITMERPW